MNIFVFVFMNLKKQGLLLCFDAIIAALMEVCHVFHFVRFLFKVISQMTLLMVSEFKRINNF